MNLIKLMLDGFSRSKLAILVRKSKETVSCLLGRETRTLDQEPTILLLARLRKLFLQAISILLCPDLHPQHVLFFSFRGPKFWDLRCPSGGHKPESSCESYISLKSSKDLVLQTPFRQSKIQIPAL